MLLIALSVIDIQFMDHLLFTVYGVVVNRIQTLTGCVSQQREGDCVKNMLRIRLLM